MAFWEDGRSRAFFAQTVACLCVHLLTRLNGLLIGTPRALAYGSGRLNRPPLLMVQMDRTCSLIQTLHIEALEMHALERWAIATLSDCRVIGPATWACPN